MAKETNKIYNRADIVQYMKDPASDKYLRMKGFTDLGKSLNAETYERRYIDEKSKRNDVTGYATEIKYAFDRFTGNKVHEFIANVHNNEEVGVTVTMLTVNFNLPGSEDGEFKAKKRDFSIIPEAEGDGTDAYSYTGKFVASGDPEEVTATTTDKWITADIKEV